MRGDIGSNLLSLGRFCLLVSLLAVPVISPTSANGDDSGQTLISAQSTGDNRADLAIGVPSDSIDSVAFAGAVNVLYSSSAGLSATNNQLWHQDSPDVEGGAETDDCFGRALAAGDFNRDGYVDLAVGVPWEDVDSVAGAGVVNVVYGSSAGLSAAGDQLWSQKPPGVAGAAEADDLFGIALVALEPVQYRAYVPSILRQ
jgi:hypothetical protein